MAFGPGRDLWMDRYCTPVQWVNLKALSRNSIWEELDQRRRQIQARRIMNVLGLILGADINWVTDSGSAPVEGASGGGHVLSNVPHLGLRFQGEQGC